MAKNTINGVKSASVSRLDFDETLIKIRTSVEVSRKLYTAKGLTAELAVLNDLGRRFEEAVEPLATAYASTGDSGMGDAFAKIAKALAGAYNL